MSKTLYTKQNVDYETGELKSTEWLRTKKVNTEQFIRAYIQDIGLLAKCSKAEMTTVLCCFKYIDWNTNEIVLNNQRRKDICECGDISFNTVNCAISRLQKKNIFVKDKGRLFLNPTLFFFGDDLSRLKMFSLTLKYEICPDCQ